MCYPTLLGQVDTSAVRLLLNKPSNESFKDLEHLAMHFVEELRKASNIDIANPWSSSAGSKPSSGSPASTNPYTPNFVEYDEKGNALGASKLALHNLGVIPGAHVMDQSENRGTVSSILIDGSIIMKFPNSKTGKVNERTVSYDDWLSSYKLASDPAEFMDWQAVAPTKSTVYQGVIVKANIQIALDSLSQKSGVPKVRVQVKPSRAVFADAAFTPQKLALVPETQRIVAIVGKEDPPTGALKCNFDVGDGATYYLCPMFSDKFGCPAWAVRVTDQKKDANLEVSYQTMKIVVSSSGGSKTAMDIELPIITNSVQVRKNDELVLFRRPPAAKPKAPKRELQLVTVQASKAAKVQS